MSGHSLWVTGAGGLIGSYLVQTAPGCLPQWKVIGLARPHLELSDFPAVRQEFRARPPDAIIHCAAMSRTPECQADPALARKMNVELTRNLSGLAAEIPFVFLSTDLVFDGRRGNYDESAATNPLSVYAETKVAAEQIVLQNPLHTVIRTSLNSGVSPTGDRAFDEQIRKAWQAGQTLKLFNDEFRSPIGAEVTARAIWQLLARNKPGLFHIAGSERLSRWQIGELLKEHWPELNAQLKPGSIAEWQGAPRPADTSLNCSKVQAWLSFPLPRWSEWLRTRPTSSCPLRPGS